ncbi:MAG TPA: hypothetical protein VEB86_01790, partial [Chryseosolibacter sp.]|nr:hypothetical protein [Chryseosolibacter sp.]
MLQHLTTFLPMLIADKNLEHWIDHFYGYGSWHAAFWFIGYEEGGGDIPEEVAEKLNYFHAAHSATTTPTLCDIRQLYRSVTFRVEGPRAPLYKNLHDYRFGNNAVQHGEWKNLIAFAHGYRNEKVPDLLQYQKTDFASPEGSREALIRLYPLPSPHNHAWYYGWLDMPRFNFLKTRALYQQHLYERRIGQVIESITTFKPEVVVMYGMDNINSLK